MTLQRHLLLLVAAIGALVTGRTIVTADTLIDYEVNGMDVWSPQLDTLKIPGYLDGLVQIGVPRLRPAAYWNGWNSMNDGWLSVFCREAHARGLLVEVYVMAAAVNEGMDGNPQGRIGVPASRYMQWTQRDFWGNDLDYWYDPTEYGYWMCMNRTGWRDFLKSRIRLAIQDGVDGIYLDIPEWADGGCYCDTCKMLFQAEYGEPAPQMSGSWQYSQACRDFDVWQYERKADFLTDLTDAAHSLAPQVRVINENVYPLTQRGSTSAQGLFFVPGVDRYTVALDPALYCDSLGGSCGWHFDDNRLIGGIALDHYFAGIAGKPFEMALYWRSNGWEDPMPSSAITRIATMERWLDGQEIWDLDPNTQGADIAAAYHLPLEHLTPRLSLVWDFESCEYAGSSVHGASDWIPEYSRLAGALYRTNHPFQTVSLEEIADKDTVILPAIRCLSPAERASLEQYPGTLMVMGDLGVFDENMGPTPALVLNGVTYIFDDLSRMQVTAQPETILANGSDTTTVTAFAVRRNGSPVPNGTIVSFSTTAGTFTTPTSVPTVGGLAQATLCSSTTPRRAVVSAALSASKVGRCPVIFAPP